MDLEGITKWNKSDRETQITYDFTYMWNLKKKKKIPLTTSKPKYSKSQTQRTDWQLPEVEGSEQAISKDVQKV